MKVTYELLDRYHDADEWKNFLKRYYPDGVEFATAAMDCHMTDSMLHFGFMYFPLEDNDIERYEQMCNLYNSQHYQRSKDIYDSQYIYDCFKIHNSNHIIQGYDVEDSSHIYNSKHIMTSDEVYRSKHITNSSRVINSKHIDDSYEILQSSNVSWSNHILNSTNVDECGYIYQSDGIQACYFSGFLKDCNNCICCSGLTNKAYHIFNMPIDPNEYERIHDLLVYRLEAEYSSFIIIDSSSETPSERYLYSNKLDSVFDGLGADFYGWIGTLPNYNEDLFLQIFLSNKNLKNIKK